MNEDRDKTEMICDQRMDIIGWKTSILLHQLLNMPDSKQAAHTVKASLTVIFVNYLLLIVAVLSADCCSSSLKL